MLMIGSVAVIFVLFFKQKTAYEIRISDWSSDVCSSDLDRVDEFKTPELYAIGRTLGGGHAVQRLADQYVKVLKDRRRQLVGDALKADWTKWVTGCSAKWGRA